MVATNEDISDAVLPALNNFSTNGEMYGIVVKNLLGQTGEKPLLDILGYSLSSINEFYPTSINMDSN